jgi:hypothetical protein
MARRSNDKGRNSHIEQTYYVDSGVSPGDEINHGRLHPTSPVYWFRDVPHPTIPNFTASRTVIEPGIPCTVIEPTECGDYSGGGLVHESNFRCLQKEFPWLVEVYGSHGYRALAYLGRRENQSDDLIEAIDSLTDYPLYSEDDHSELESERESAEWDEHGAKDFRRELATIFDNADDDYEHDADNISDDDLFELWRDGCDVYNVNGGSGFINEQGNSIHFYIDDWVADYERGPDRAASYSRNHAHETFRERLRTLAEQTRIHDVAADVLLVIRDSWLEDANSDRTIALLNAHVPPHFQASVLATFEIELARTAKACDVCDGVSEGNTCCA